MNVTGTVVDDSGIPVSGATVSLAMGGDAGSVAVSDADGHYAITLAAAGNFGGHADKAGYDTTWRDSYFAAGPGVLNFRLFRTLWVTDAGSAHLIVTPDGSVCGIDDEWLCRMVRVSVTRAGRLEVQGTADDPSVHPTIAIGEVGYDCCPAPTSVIVSAGADVLVYVQLPWTSPGTGVTVRAFIY